MELHRFYTGTEFEAFRWLGAHPSDEGTLFRVFAPGAAAVGLMGEFSHWQEIPMTPLHSGSFYQCFVPEAKPGMSYLLRIHKTGGTEADHLDPYGFCTAKEESSQFYSVIWDQRSYSFSDGGWMARRTDGISEPMNIYELHLGSWKEGLTYRSIAAPLIAYVKEAGYNCVEFMPLCEHPALESWGYQAFGYFSPTHRYGTPDDLKYLIDQCHRHGIRVILDLALVHFAVDAFGLAEFDGTPLYEYPQEDLSFSEWGSKNFNYARGSVRSFLQSAVLFWLQEYHFDGIRMDAVRNMLYPHGNTDLGEHREGAAFLRTMNKYIKKVMPTACLIAEDSSAYPGVTSPVDQGGLGFDYKWDLGWMNDTLTYCKMSPEERLGDYHRLTFSMLYYYNERFLLPFSHDEVVHGKSTILQKMNGDYAEKFSMARALYLYMYAYPGKKLNFMGNEFGQLREWDEKREQDWLLLDYPAHSSFYRCIRDLNRLYLSCPALYQRDYDPRGFHWLDCREGNLVYTFTRSSREQRMLAVFNFDHQPVADYRLELPCITAARLVLDTNWERYGGTLKTVPGDLGLDSGGLTLRLEPCSGKLITLLPAPEYEAMLQENEQFDTLPQEEKAALMKKYRYGCNNYGPAAEE